MPSCSATKRNRLASKPSIRLPIGAAPHSAMCSIISRRSSSASTIGSPIAKPGEGGATQGAAKTEMSIASPSSRDPAAAPLPSIWPIAAARTPSPTASAAKPCRSSIATKPTAAKVWPGLPAGTAARWRFWANDSVHHRSLCLRHDRFVPRLFCLQPADHE